MINLRQINCLILLFWSALIITSCTKSKCNFAEMESCLKDWKLIEPSMRQSFLDNFTDSLTNSEIAFLASKLGLERIDSINLIAFQGDTVSAKEAIKFTNEYYQTNPGFENAKSVYFDLDSIYNFISAYKNFPTPNACSDNGTNGVKGIRLYFARYPSDYGALNNPSKPDDPRHVALRHKNHVIIRLTCNNDDLPHHNDLGIPVAYNFGDVCPPMCDPFDDTAYTHCGGKYDSTTASPQFGICPKYRRDQ